LPERLSPSCGNPRRYEMYTFITSLPILHRLYLLSHFIPLISPRNFTPHLCSQFTHIPTHNLSSSSIHLPHQLHMHSYSPFLPLPIRSHCRKDEHVTCCHMLRPTTSSPLHKHYPIHVHRRLSTTRLIRNLNRRNGLIYCIEIR